MKHFSKLSIAIVPVLVTSVASVNLCCADIVQTNVGLLTQLNYTGSVPIDIAEGCTPFEGSCELLATTCESSLADNTFGINCAATNVVRSPALLDYARHDSVFTHTFADNSSWGRRIMLRTDPTNARYTGATVSLSGGIRGK
ncbi:hypothetical protein C8R45DRAFT_927720 [Mycena sanguinolenta]|nr:hypothetical protein C8R45DRAFT_927720 [Mycena sanguinolenta]